MGKGVAAQQHRLHVVHLQHGVLRFQFLDTFAAQADVEHLQLTDILLVFGEEHGQLALPEGKGKRGAYDVGADVIGIVLGHQTRGHVNTHHFGLRGVDILHQGGETARQRLVQP